MTNGQARTRAMAHIGGLMFGVPLAVTPARAAAILAAVGHRVLGLDTESVDAAEQLTRRTPKDEGGASYSITSDGIAVVPVMGTFVKRASMMDAMSGLVSYAEVGRVLDTALADEAVKGIVLQIDSPGGQVNGLFDLADAVEAARARKPMAVFVDELAASAAYLIAATAGGIVVPATGVTGSIGVIAIRVDQTEADAKAGVSYEIVSAGARKADGNPHTAMSDAERTALEVKVGKINDMLVGRVAARRNMKADAVTALEAGTFLGGDGVAAGLVDKIGTLDDAIAIVRGRVEAQQTEAWRRGKRMGANTEGTEAITIEGQPAPAGAEVIDFEKAKAEAQAKARDEVRAETAAITKACKEAGVPDLAARFLEQGLTLAEATARLGTIADIKAVCAAGKCPERASDFIARGLTKEAAAHEILTARAEADAATAITSHVGEQATIVPPSGPVMMSSTEAARRWKNGNRPTAA